MQYKVYFKCDICKNTFEIECERLLEAVEIVARDGCPDCNDQEIPFEDRKVFLMGHEIIKNDVEETDEQAIEHSNYGWECFKRDLI